MKIGYNADLNTGTVGGSITYGTPEDVARSNRFLATLSEYNGKPLKTQT